MEFLTNLATAPTSTLLVLGGIAFLFISFVTLKKPIVLELTAQSRMVAGIVGGLMLVAGVIISLIGTQPAQTAPTPTIEPTAIPSATTIPTSIPIVTTAPAAENTPTLPPLSSKLLEPGCFNATLWSFSPGQTIPPELSQGCIQLNSWGWTPTEDGLTIFIKNSKTGDSVGLYTAISLNTDITFNLEMKRLYSIGNAAAQLSIGVIDMDEPRKGAFLIFNETTDQSRAEFQTGDTLKNYRFLGPYFKYNKVQELKMILQGTKVSFYLDGQRLTDMAVSMTKPAFWIGNHFNTGGDVDLVLSHLVIRVVPE